jgi:hypothetical protein
VLFAPLFDATTWWYLPSAGTPVVERAIVETFVLRSQTWLPLAAVITISCRPLLPLFISWWVTAAELRLIQPSAVNVSPTSSDAESGTRPMSSMPSKLTAVFGSPDSAPGTPAVGPPR